MIRCNYITTTEFANYNPELDLSNYTDATISGMITRASAYMDNYLQYSLVTEAITGEKTEAVVNTTGELVIFTRKLNIQSVQAIKLNVGPTAVSLALNTSNGQSNLQIPARGTSVVYPWMPFAWTGSVAITNFFNLRNWDIYATIDYTAGYDLNNLPPDLKDACSLVTRDIFIRQANPMDLYSMSQGGISMAFKGRGAETGKTGNIMMAENIMNSYKRFLGV